MKRFESSEKNVKIFDAAGIILWDWPLQEGYVSLSDFRKFSGRRSGKVSLPLDELLAYVLPEDRETLQAKIKDCLLRKTDMWEALVRMRPHSGGQVWMRVRGAVAERDAHGKALLASGMLQDVTLFVESQEQLSQYRGEAHRYGNILRKVSDMAAELLSAQSENFSGVVVEALHKLAQGAEADRAAVLRNFTRDDALCMRFLFEWRADISLRIRWGEDAHFTWSDFGDWGKRLARGEYINAHTDSLSGKGKHFLEERGVRSVLFIPIILDKEFWGAVYMSDEKRVRLSNEQEVRALQSGAMLIALSVLRNETHERLVEAMKAAQSSARAKTAFLANMSHEMRTPMNAILGMVSIAARTPEKAEDCLQRIELAARYMMSVINDVLDMASLETNHFQLVNAPFPLARLLRSVQSTFEHAAEEKGQTLTVDAGSEAASWFTGDEMRLARVLNCLIYNSIKFTPEGGAITVTVLEAGKDGARYPLRISVRDTGIGMDKHLVDTFFLPFEQAEKQLSRSYEGAGLGLAISAGIVKMMGGVIDVESEPGKGSVFTVCVPAPRYTPPEEPSAPEQAEEGAAPDFSGKRILLAEDNEVNREIILAMLEETRASVDCAVNGLEAYEAVREAPDAYDLILMDIHMPIMDGLEATEKIREIPDGTAASVPILAVSANCFPADVERCANSGMNGLIAKPVNFAVMLETMQNFLPPEAGPPETQGMAQE